MPKHQITNDKKRRKEQLWYTIQFLRESNYKAVHLCKIQNYNYKIKLITKILIPGLYHVIVRIRIIKKYIENMTPRFLQRIETFSPNYSVRLT